ncbi:MAG: GAF domain-containing protein [Ignavibacteriales bacterium]
MNNLMRESNPDPQVFPAVFGQLAIAATWIGIFVVFLAVIFDFFAFSHITIMYYLIIIASAYNLLMQLIILHRVYSRVIMQLWGLTDIILISILIYASGGINSPFVIYLIPLLVLFGEAYTYKQSILLGPVVTVLYCAACLLGLPKESIPGALPKMGLYVIVFLTTSWIAAYLVREIRQQTISHEEYKRLERSAFESHVLFESTQILNTLGSIQEVLDYACERIVKLSGLEKCVTAVYNRQNSSFTVGSTFGVNIPGLEDFLARVKNDLSTLSLKSSKAVVVHDAANNPTIHQPTVDFFKVKSFIIAPVMYRDRIYGSFYIYNSSKKVRIDAAAVALTEAFCQIVSISIENIMLINDLSRKIRTFADLYDLLNSLHHFDELVDPALIANKIGDLMDAEFCAYFHYSEKHENLSLTLPGHNLNPADWGITEEVFRIPVNAGIVFDAYYGTNPVLIPCLADHPSVFSLPAEFSRIRDVIAIRLGHSPRMSGILFVANKINGSFSDDDLQLIALIANPITTLLDNRRLLNNIETKMHNLSDLMDVANAVQGSLSLEDILDTILEKAYYRFNACTGQIDIYDPKTGQVEVSAYKGFEPDQENREKCRSLGLNCPCMTNNSTCIFGSGDSSQSCVHFTSHNPSIKSYMCAPLRVENEPVGVIHITSLKSKAFSQTDLALLGSFAVEASLAVQRGHLFAALAEENAKIETIIRSIEDPLIMFGPDGVLHKVNEAFLSYFALEGQDVIGNTIWDIIDSSLHKIEIGTVDLKGFLAQALPEAKRYSATCTIISPNESRYSEVTLTPLTDVRGLIKGSLCLFHDVTEFQSLLKQYGNEKFRAEAANRLKGEFLANVSHELRTPLNSIIGYAQCVLDELDGPINEAQARDINQVVNSSEDLLKLINNLLDLSKIESGKAELVREMTPPDALAREVIISLFPMAQQQDLIIKEDIEADLPSMYTDSFRVKQVLINLVANALKFTIHGTITVGVHYDPVRECIVYSVSDTGIGIKSDVLPYIFDEFRQADGSITRRFGGTGLGLTISRQLVEILDGNIWAESTEDLGSRFYFTIPLTPSRLFD